MTKLPDDAPLRDRTDQLLKATERALLQASLAVKQLEVVKESLSPRMQFIRRSARIETDEGDEFLYETMSDVSAQAYMRLIDATEAIGDAIISDDDEEPE